MIFKLFKTITTYSEGKATHVDEKKDICEVNQPSRVSVVDYSLVTPYLE